MKSVASREAFILFRTTAFLSIGDDHSCLHRSCGLCDYCFPKQSVRKEYNINVIWAMLRFCMHVPVRCNLEGKKENVLVVQLD